MRSDLNFKFVSNKDDSDIAIDYIEHLEGNQVGITKPSHITIQGKVYLHKVSVLISKTDAWRFIQSDAELLKVTLHEIGHAIGILGHSENINDIMQTSAFSASQKKIELVKQKIMSISETKKSYQNEMNEADGNKMMLAGEIQRANEKKAIEENKPSEVFSTQPIIISIFSDKIVNSSSTLFCFSIKSELKK